MHFTSKRWLFVVNQIQSTYSKHNNQFNRVYYQCRFNTAVSNVGYLHKPASRYIRNSTHKIPSLVPNKTRKLIHSQTPRATVLKF